MIRRFISKRFVWLLLSASGLIGLLTMPAHLVPPKIDITEVRDKDGKHSIYAEVVKTSIFSAKLRLQLEPIKDQVNPPRNSISSRRGLILINEELSYWPLWRTLRVDIPEDIAKGEYRITADIRSGDCRSGFMATPMFLRDDPCKTLASTMSEKFMLPGSPSYLGDTISESIRLDMLKAAGDAASLPVVIHRPGYGKYPLDSLMRDWRIQELAVSYSGDDICITGDLPHPAPGKVNACINKYGYYGQQEYYRRDDVRYSFEGLTYPDGVMAIKEAKEVAANELDLDPDNWKLHKVRYIHDQAKSYWLFEKYFDQTIAVLKEGTVCHENASNQDFRCFGINYEICDDDIQCYITYF